MLSPKVSKLSFWLQSYETQKSQETELSWWLKEKLIFRVPSMSIGLFAVDLDAGLQTIFFFENTRSTPKTIFTCYELCVPLLVLPPVTNPSSDTDEGRQNNRRQQQRWQPRPRCVQLLCPVDTVAQAGVCVCVCKGRLIVLPLTGMSQNRRGRSPDIVRASLKNSCPYGRWRADPVTMVCWTWKKIGKQCWDL